MAILVTDPAIEEQLCLEREASGADRYDEVWDGIYMMAPMPDDEHQYLVLRLGYILEDIVGIPGQGQVRAGVNLSDRKTDWKNNYRVPDVAVFLNDGKAENQETHWCGAADFLVEIISQYDKSRDKVPFYERLGVREVLLIDRDPWKLELWRFQNGSLSLAGTSSMGSSGVDTSDRFTSLTVSLSFGLHVETPRPKIDVKHVESDRQWLV